MHVRRRQAITRHQWASPKTLAQRAAAGKQQRVAAAIVPREPPSESEASGSGNCRQLPRTAVSTESGQL